MSLFPTIVCRQTVNWRLRLQHGARALVDGSGGEALKVVGARDRFNAEVFHGGSAWDNHGGT